MEQVNILQLSLHMYYILIMRGIHVAHRDTDTDTGTPTTQGNKIQSWQFASCPTENSQRRIYFEIHHLFTVFASEHGSLL